MLAGGVVLTWVALTALFISLGLWVTLFAKRSYQLARIRVALWLGLAQVVLLLILINFFAPLQSESTIWIVVALALVSLITWIAKRGWTLGSNKKQKLAFKNLWTAIPIVLLGFVILLVAHAFAGPLNNWDSGLYQINAIQYSAQYPIIPGLANLHERLGTNTTSSLISAMLAATPWGIEAFRLLVGLFIFLFSVDLVLRLFDSNRRCNSPGLILMLLAALSFVPFLLSDPAGWITGPTPDTISMILVVVSTAYMLDAFWSRNLVWGTVASVVAVIAATVRTQLWVYAGLVVVVVLVHAWHSPTRRQAWRNSQSFVAIGGVVIFLLGIGMMVRDYFLSGWLLFPATLLPMPVDWRVPDPAASREWIMSWAREPGATPEDVLNSWDWLWPWVGRTAADWSLQIMIGSLVAAALIWLLLRSKPKLNASSHRIGFKGLSLLLIPTLVSLVVWFVAAPDPRFAWGSMLALGLIPLSLALVHVGTRFTPAKGTNVIIALTAAFMAFAIAGPIFNGLVNVKGYVQEGFELREYSFGPITITANINPVETATITEFTLDDGNVILTPTQDDRCHLAFPLCRPYPDQTMQFRGDSVEDGFRSTRTETD